MTKSEKVEELFKRFDGTTNCDIDKEIRNITFVYSVDRNLDDFETGIEVLFDSIVPEHIIITPQREIAINCIEYYKGLS